MDAYDVVIIGSGTSGQTAAFDLYAETVVERLRFADVFGFINTPISPICRGECYFFRRR